MEGPSVDWENLSPKSKFMMSYIPELVEKLDRWEKLTVLMVRGVRGNEGWREIGGKKGGRGMEGEERNLERRNWICLNGQRVVRLVTLEFGEYALFWWT
ncbi:hypothetical protein CR513_29397, partial [Mucuna pruriens]